MSNRKKCVLPPSSDPQVLADRLADGMSQWLVFQMQKNLTPEEWEVFAQLDPDNPITTGAIQRIMTKHQFDVTRRYDSARNAVEVVLFKNHVKIGVAFFGE
jgi:hypothetical protein